MDVVAGCSIASKKFNAQGLANLAWSCATMQFSPQALQHDIGEEALKILHSFTEQNLANMAWAVAKLLWREASPLFCAISSLALSKMPEFFPQALANMAWAVANFSSARDAGDGDLLNAIAAKSIQIMPQFNHQNMANLL